MAGDMSIGMLVAFQTIASGFLNPLGKLINFASSLQELEASLERLDDVLDNPLDEDLEITEAVENDVENSVVEAGNNLEKLTFYDKKNAPNGLLIPYSPLKGKVELRDITFG